MKASESLREGAAAEIISPVARETWCVKPRTDGKFPSFATRTVVGLVSENLGAERFPIQGSK